MTTSTALAPTDGAPAPDDVDALASVINDMKLFAKRPGTLPALRGFIEDYLVTALEAVVERMDVIEASLPDDDGEDEDDGDDVAIEVATASKDAIIALSALLDGLLRSLEWIDDAGPTANMPDTFRAQYNAANGVVANAGTAIRDVLEDVDDDENDEEEGGEEG